MYKKIMLWLIFVCLMSLPFVPLLRPGIHNIQDNMQFFRIYEMTKCFSDWQIPCHWVPDIGYQYGYPLYLFYPPGPYYLGAAMHVLGFSLLFALKALFVLGFVGSFLAMYFFLKYFLSKDAAIVGSILYLYAPVRAVQVYVRGSLSEFLAFVFFPLLFLFGMRSVKENRRFDGLWFALSLTGLLLTHNLMAFIFAPILGNWLVYWLIIEKKWRNVWKITVATLVGLGLASFFLLPLVIERPYVHIESLLGGYFGYRQHFVSLRQLFLENNWGYGSSQLGAQDDLSLSVGVHWVFAVLAIGLAGLTFRKNRVIASLSFVLALSELLLLFLMHQKSVFIWERIQILQYLQFPWRLLVLSNFVLSILGAIFIYLLPKKLILVISGISILLVLFLHAGFFRPQNWLAVNDNDLLNGPYFVKQLTSSIFDYLPKSAVLPPNKRAPTEPEVLDGVIQFASYFKGSDYQYGQVDVGSALAKIRVPLFDFPGMTVQVDGKTIAHNHSNCEREDFCFGLINFQIPKGQHHIRVSLLNTWDRSAGNIISLASVGFCLIWLVRSNKYAP